MRIGICDSNREYLQYLTVLLRQIWQVGECCIKCYTDPRWLEEDVMNRAEVFDLLLITREQGNESGVDMAIRIQQTDPGCRMILLSNNNCIQDDMYLMRNGVFLPKEKVTQFLAPLVQRIVESIHHEKERYFTVIVNRDRRYIPSSQILYMEKLLRKTIIVTKTETFETYQQPLELLEACGCQNFVQCHRSFFVNMQWIYALSATHVKLSGLIVIPVGKTFSASLRSCYKAYCTGEMHECAPRGNG